MCLSLCNCCVQVSGFIQLAGLAQMSVKQPRCENTYAFFVSKYFSTEPISWRFEFGEPQVHEWGFIPNFFLSTQTGKVGKMTSHSFDKSLINYIQSQKPPK